MKFLFIVLALLVATPMAASAANEFGIRAPEDWTPDLQGDEPNVGIETWYTEGGTTVQEHVFIGPLQPGETRPIDAEQFVGSGRTICIEGYSYYVDEPATQALAVPACRAFPRSRLAPFELSAP